MKFGICGYGNLGKAVEKTIKTCGEELVGIFSRRQTSSPYGTRVFAYDKAQEFDLDVMFMCGGSQEDLLWQSPDMLKHFNIIDTFDTHARIEEHKRNLLLSARESGHVAIYSCGWDPGLFSEIRVLSKSIFGSKPQTFWGKGVSQGHSEALRNIKGIADAIQFTVPNEEIYNLAKNNPSLPIDENDKHERHCFVCLDGTRSLEDVRAEILQTENYFKNQKVFVEVCSQQKIDELKKNMFHKGSVFAGDEACNVDFSVKMESNPDFTSKIMYAYSKAILKLSPGAYNVLEIPISYLASKSYEKEI